MRECCICGKKATIYAGKRWWCEHHYLMLKERAKKVNESSETLNENLSKMDFGLVKV